MHAKTEMGRPFLSPPRGGMVVWHIDNGNPALFVIEGIEGLSPQKPCGVAILRFSEKSLGKAEIH